MMDLGKNLLILIVSICSLLLTQCSSNKEIVDFNKVKVGEQLALAVELTVDEFFQNWIRNTDYSKIDGNMVEYYKGEVYTYFGDRTMSLNTSKSIRLFKVSTDSLSKNFANYSRIHGGQIRQKFWIEIVPESDKKAYENMGCDVGSTSSRYKYAYGNDEIQISMHYKVKCNFFTILDVMYSAKYIISTQSLVDKGQGIVNKSKIPSR